MVNLRSGWSYNLYYEGTIGETPGTGAIEGEDPLFADFSLDGNCTNDDLSLV